MTDDERYPCIGICQADPQSGLCQGCGRPLIVVPAPAEGPSDEPAGQPLDESSKLVANK